MLTSHLQVYAHRAPADAASRRIVCLTQRQIGGTTRALTGMRKVTVLTRVECPVDTPNAEVFHAMAHELIRKNLVGQKPAVDTSVELTAFHQTLEADAPLPFDDEKLVSLSGYSLILTPVNGYNN